MNQKKKKLTVLIVGILCIFVPLAIFALHGGDNKETATNATVTANKTNNETAKGINNTTTVENKTVLLIPGTNQAVLVKDNKTQVLELSDEPMCIHGSVVTLRDGRRVCTRKYSGAELRNMSLENVTVENATRYVYYRKNCTLVPDGYVWDRITPIVNSSHELTCKEIYHWV